MNKKFKDINKESGTIDINSDIRLRNHKIIRNKSFLLLLSRQEKEHLEELAHSLGKSKSACIRLILNSIIIQKESNFSVKLNLNKRVYKDAV